MSLPHPMLGGISLQDTPDDRLENMVDQLASEFGYGCPSIEERTSRAEALAFLAIEMIRRMKAQ